MRKLAPVHYIHVPIGTWHYSHYTKLVILLCPVLAYSNLNACEATHYLHNGTIYNLTFTDLAITVHPALAHYDNTILPT